jgi:hypothetical protein
LQAQDSATVFTRALTYQVEPPEAVVSRPDDLDRLMRVQSEQAVNQLKALVENILRDEAIEMP